MLNTLSRLVNVTERWGGIRERIDAQHFHFHENENNLYDYGARKTQMM